MDSRFCMYNFSFSSWNCILLHTRPCIQEQIICNSEVIIQLLWLGMGNRISNYLHKFEVMPFIMLMPLGWGKT